MGQYDFDYAIPENFNITFSLFLQNNDANELGKHIKNCNVDFDDLGFAYYQGMSGNNWNKHALNVTITGDEKDISCLKKAEQALKNKMELFPGLAKSGFLIKKINFIIDNKNFEINLPNTTGESFNTLSSDIHDAISKNEPALVLDRLHTYSIRYLRGLCDDHSIPISNNKGKNYPLHSLVGMLIQHYSENISFQSDFVDSTLKMTISAFERFNAIRNNHSYAHDNEVLNKAEAVYVISIITATLRLFEDIEDSYYFQF